MRNSVKTGYISKPFEKRGRRYRPTLQYYIEMIWDAIKLYFKRNSPSKIGLCFQNSLEKGLRVQASPEENLHMNFP